MLIRIQDLPSGTHLETDICVVGAGAGGIALAREFIGRSTDICLVEAGGLREEPATQALYKAANIGLPYFALDESRYRYFGGSTNRWTGWCRPLDAIDFSHRPWIPDAAWPITKEEMAPYYRRAEDLCQLDSDRYDDQAWRDAIPDLYRLPNADEILRTVVWQGSPPTKFGVAYRDAFERESNVRTLLDANVVEVSTDHEGKLATGVRVRTLAGSEYRISARCVVLAAGALETARILLASKRVKPAGLGNDHDNVGRYFMEHPHLVTGRIVLSKGSTTRPSVPAIDRGMTGVLDRLRLRRPIHGIKCAFTVQPALHEKHRLLNYSTHFNPVAATTHADTRGYRSLKLLVSNMRSWRKIAAQLRHRQLPDGVARQIKNVIMNPIDAAAGIYEEILQRPAYLELYTQAEQCPNPNSRVTLSDDIDAIGMRRLVLDWRLSQLDKESIRRSQAMVAGSLERAGIGQLEEPEWLKVPGDDWGTNLNGGYHHLGTARMSDDARSGVVNKDGLVHGMANLYVADGSVFPTGGFANPLLTIAALACRLADHLKTVIR